MFGDVDIPAIIGVMTGFCLVVVVPIVGMLLTHQRRMAELVRGDQARQGASDERILRLEHEIATLRQQLAENIIAVDDRRSLMSAPPPAPQVIERH